MGSRERPAQLARAVGASAEEAWQVACRVAHQPLRMTAHAILLQSHTWSCSVTHAILLSYTRGLAQLHTQSCPHARVISLDCTCRLARLRRMPHERASAACVPCRDEPR